MDEWSVITFKLKEIDNLVKCFPKCERIEVKTVVFISISRSSLINIPKYVRSVFLYLQCWYMSTKPRRRNIIHSDTYVNENKITITIVSYEFN